MRLVLFRTRGASALAPLRVGALHANGTHVADISAAHADNGGAALTSMRVFLEMGIEAGNAGRAVAELALSSPAYHRSLEHVDLRAPIYDPCVAARRRRRRARAHALARNAHLAPARAAEPSSRPPRPSAGRRSSASA